MPDTFTPDRILRLRRHLKRTQAEMARVFGVHKQTWNRWEKGHTEPAPRDREKLEVLYNKYVLSQPRENEVVR